jgi:ABC-type amino acid transport system permease subunit
MQSPYAHGLPTAIARTTRVRTISFIGPVVIAGGVIWAMLQPYRLTILHPRGQGFWWLVLEPPLLVALVGLAFIVLVARPLLADLEASDASAR